MQDKIEKENKRLRRDIDKLKYNYNYLLGEISHLKGLNKTEKQVNKKLKDKLNKIKEEFNKYHYDYLWVREIADLQLDEFVCLVNIYKIIDKESK